MRLPQNKSYLNFHFKSWRRSGAVIHRCSIKKLFGKVSRISQESIFAGVLFYQVADLKLATLIVTRVQHICFSMNFMKFLRTCFCEMLLFFMERFIIDVI